jgi:hypothetical protein
MIGTIRYSPGPPSGGVKFGIPAHWGSTPNPSLHRPGNAAAVHPLGGGQLLLCTRYNSGMQWTRCVLPLVVFLGMLFLLTPWSQVWYWKHEGDGRILTRKDTLSLEVTGFTFAEGYTNGGRTPQWDLAINPAFPTICICLLAAGWMVIRELRVRARPRDRFGCISCGYDLRATPDRCPECGHVPETSA